MPPKTEFILFGVYFYLLPPEMDFCSDIIREILKYTDDYMPCAFISPSWRVAVQEKIEEELTIWQVLFPAATAFPAAPMPDILLGNLQDKKTRQVYVETVEKWLKKWGDKRGNERRVKDFNIPLISEKWGPKCQQDKIFIFTKEWRKYFNSVRFRLYAVAPIYSFVGGVGRRAAAARYNTTLNTIINSRGESLLLNFRFEDKLNRRLMRKLEKTKDWICWNPIIDDGEIDGYEFDGQIWRDLEKVYSYITARPVRDPPEFPPYIPGNESAITLVDGAGAVDILRNIRKHR
jgi:hypothetical protein